VIWHVLSADFVRYLIGQGFDHVGQTERHDIYERGKTRVQVRRSRSLTQAEVDAASDGAGLNPPPFDSFFGD